SSANASLMAAICMILGMSLFPLASWYQCHLNALQPECHLHGAVKLDSGGKLGVCLLWTAYPIIQDAKAVLAVGQEWTHAQYVSQSEGLLVEGFGLLDLRGITMCGNLAEEAQGIGFVAAFLVRTGERQRALGEGVRLLQAARQQLRLPQGE